jgi:hypothetical protein
MDVFFKQFRNGTHLMVVFSNQIVHEQLLFHTDFA